MGFRLGAYDVEREIGRGGMGVVHRARHRASNTDVALKLVMAGRARDLAFVEAFRREVHAVARLEHPCIVRVLDFGCVQSDEAADAALDPGAPYLVMELLEHGTLRGSGCGASFALIRATLLMILDGLAHSHARGVLHRDLKPENVLLAPDGLRLADFGIADAFAAGGGEDASVRGTPAYMAPEQLRGDVRAQGPWTDLYALGCLAYELASGELPFAGESFAQLVVAHLTTEPRPFAARVPVPDGFAPWLGGLLVKDPRRRIRRAADAAHALASMVPLDPPSPRGPSAWPLDPETLIDSPTTLSFASAPTLPLGPSPPEIQLESVAPIAASRPALPERWQTARAPSPRLTGAGLGLFGLRPVPVVGRERERDRAWAALRAVADGCGPRALLLRGPSGAGKTRLCEWLAERAHELGAATVLRASHGALSGPTHGLGAMLARHLRATGLADEELAGRVQAFAGHADGFLARGLREVCGELGTSSAAERHAVLHEALSRLARERPLLVVLEDVQWGLDALAFARRELSRPRRTALPALFVITAQDEALERRPREAAMLEQLEPSADVMEVRPLDDEQHEALVRHLIGLTPALHAEVVRRTAGSSLFAVQLVGDLVARGALVGGAEGFGLPPGEAASLPDDIHALWAARLSRCLAELPAPQRSRAERALWLAAALGREVRDDEWAAACRADGVEPSTDLLPRLEARGLVTVADGRWWWAHDLLHLALDRLAREAGARVGLHRACARMLEGRAGAGVAERVGRHWLEAGDLEAAVAPLFAAARERSDRSDFLGAMDLLHLAADALDRAGVPEADPRAVFADLEAIHQRMFLHQYAEARARLDAIAPRVTEPRALGRLGYLEGSLRLREGRPELADPPMLEALERLERLDDPLGAARCRFGLGDAAHRRGELDRAAEQYRLAAEAHAALGWWTGQGHSLNGLANSLVESGRADEGAAVRLEAIAAHRRTGSRYGVACALYDGACLELRRAGRHEEAASRLAEAAALFDELGSEATWAALEQQIVEVAAAGDAERAEELEDDLRHARAVRARGGLA